MADLETLRIRIEANLADTPKAIRDLNGLLNAQNKILRANAQTMKESEEATRRAGNSHREFSKWVKGTATEINSVMSILGRLSSAFGAVFKAVEDAARTQTAKQYFDAAGKSLENLRRASQGMVSDANLMKKANLADSMGLSNKVFENLIRVAQAASAKTGQSFDHMFDSIVLGTARSSRLLLDNLGIIVSVKEANRRFAEEAIKNGEAQGRSINEVIKAMTAEAKQQAFLNEMQRATVGQLKEFEKLGVGGAGVFDKWSAAVDNLKQALGTKLLPALTTVLAKLTELANKVSDSMNTNPLEGMRRVAASGFRGEDYTFAGTRVRATTFLGNDREDKEVIEDFRKATAALAEELGGAELVLAHLRKDGTLPLEEQFDATTGTMTRLDTASNDVIDRFNALNRRFKVFVSEGPGGSGGGENPLLDYGGGGGSGKGKDDSVYYGYEDHPKNPLRPLDANVWMAAYLEQEKMIQKAVAYEVDAKRAGQQRIIDDYLAAYAYAEAERIRIFEEELNPYRASLQTLFSSLSDSLGTLGSVAGNGGSAYAQAIGAMGGAALTAFGLPPQIGSALGGLFGTLLEKLPGVIAIGDAMMNGFTDLIVNALGPVTDAFAPMAPVIQKVLGAFGELAGALLSEVAVVMEDLVPSLILFWEWFSFGIQVVAKLMVMWFKLIRSVETFWAALTQDLLPATNALVAAFNQAIGAVERFTGASLNSSSGGSGGFNPGSNGMTRVDQIRSRIDSLNMMKRMMPSATAYVNQEIARLTEILASLTGLNTENTDALSANTAALRDLARELHNMPAGYKTDGAIYAASDPESGLPNRGGRGWLHRIPGMGRTVEMSRRQNDWR